MPRSSRRVIGRSLHRASDLLLSVLTRDERLLSQRRPPTRRRHSVTVAGKWVSLLSAACINPLMRHVCLLNASLLAATSPLLLSLLLLLLLLLLLMHHRETLLVVRSVVLGRGSSKFQHVFTGFQRTFFAVNNTMNYCLSTKYS